jgi:hypothetical protein
MIAVATFGKVANATGSQVSLLPKVHVDSVHDTLFRVKLEPLSSYQTNLCYPTMTIAHPAMSNKISRNL